MHSTEVGPSQAAPLVAWRLASAGDPRLLEQLRRVVYMMVPCHNPDGMDMVVAHWRKYKGTKYEGCSLPGVYHKYVGHDNNRDFVTLTQSDTKAIARIYNLDWFPQVMVEKHQMGSTGPRYFVPPFHDPIAEVIDADLWNWMGVFGANLMKDMTSRGLAGVSKEYVFDDYWPGSTETCIWKNVIGFLTECAGARLAKPVFVEPTELSARGKGLAEYKKSVHMPLPWKGGWWRLSDIVEYELASTLSILETAAAHREEILRFRNDLCRKEVRLGRTQAPFYYVLPLAQRDQGELVALVRLLQEQGVKVFRLKEAARAGRRRFSKGDLVVPLAQPFRAFLLEVMEKQEFPLRHYTPGGEIIRPYDITTWSLPLHRGLECVKVEVRSPSLEKALEPVGPGYTLLGPPPAVFAAALFPVSRNESFKAAFHALGLGLIVRRTLQDFQAGDRLVPRGSFLVEKGDSFGKILADLGVSPVYLDQVPRVKTRTLRMPRIGLVETWFSDMDAGWTRFILDTYHVPYEVLRPAGIQEADLASFDVLLFPDSAKSILMEGKREVRKGVYAPSSLPPEYARGMGKKGLSRLLAWIDGGGIVLSWGRSVELFLGPLAIDRGKKGKEEFRFPIRNRAKDLAKAGLYCPGSLVRVRFLQGHPLTLGMPPEAGAFYRGRAAFSTSIPIFDMDRRVVGWFPEKGILMSGFARKEALLARKVVLVWLRKGKGQVVLCGFQPQFRASTQGTFKILFNGLFLAPLR